MHNNGSSLPDFFHKRLILQIIFIKSWFCSSSLTINNICRYFPSICSFFLVYHSIKLSFARHCNTASFWFSSSNDIVCKLALSRKCHHVETRSIGYSIYKDFEQLHTRRNKVHFVNQEKSLVLRSILVKVVNGGVSLIITES